MAAKVHLPLVKGLGQIAVPHGQAAKIAGSRGHGPYLIQEASQGKEFIWQGL